MATFPYAPPSTVTPARWLALGDGAFSLRVHRGRGAVEQLRDELVSADVTLARELIAVLTSQPEQQQQQEASSLFRSSSFVATSALQQHVVGLRQIVNDDDRTAAAVWLTSLRADPVQQERTLDELHNMIHTGSNTGRFTADDCEQSELFAVELMAGTVPLMCVTVAVCGSIVYAKDTCWRCLAWLRRRSPSSSSSASNNVIDLSNVALPLLSAACAALCSPQQHGHVRVVQPLGCVRHSLDHPPVSVTVSRCGDDDYCIVLDDAFINLWKLHLV